MVKSGVFLVAEVRTWGDAASFRGNSQPVMATPFQLPGWLAAWQAAFRPAARLAHLTISDRQGNMLDLPLVIERRGPFRLADVPGGKHASYHAPVVIGDVAHWPHIALRAALVDGLRALGCDALTLSDAPRCWGDRPNPLALPEAQGAPDRGYGLSLEADGAAVMARLNDKDDRKKLRQKEKRLSEFGPVVARWIDSEEREAALKQFIQWKSTRFAEKGIADPFANAEAQAFLTAASAGEAPALRLFGLYAGERLVSLLGGADAPGHLSGMVIAHDPEPEIQRNSPGDLLVAALIPVLCTEGYTGLDLGVGHARYKAHYCPQPIPLFDLALPASLNGRIAARLFLTLRRAKRFVKQNPELLARLRKLKARG